VEPADVPESVQHASERTQEIIRFRTGVGFDRPHTLSETAEKFGLSREQVRKLEAEVLFKR
jgi:DNA-directed RNA polymerase sigma subunit (sigma70/sigma32)